MKNKSTQWQSVVLVAVGFIGFLGFEPLAQAQTKTVVTTTAPNVTTTSTDKTSTSTQSLDSVPNTSTSTDDKSTSTTSDTSTSLPAISKDVTTAPITDSTSSSSLPEPQISDFSASVFFRGSGFNLGTTQTDQARRLTALYLYQSNETPCNFSNISNINGHPVAAINSAVDSHLQITDNIPELDGYKSRMYSTAILYNKNTFWTMRGTAHTVNNTASSTTQTLDFIPPNVDRSQLIFLPIIRGYKINNISGNGIGVKTLALNISQTLSSDRQNITITLTPTVASFEGTRDYTATVYFDLIVYDPAYWAHKAFSWVGAYNAALDAGNSAPIITTGSGDATQRTLDQTFDLGLPLASKDQAFVGFYKYGFNTSSTTPFEFDKFQASASVKEISGNSLTVQMTGAVYGHQGAFYTDPEKTLNPRELKGYVIYCKDPEVCKTSTSATGTGSSSWVNKTYVHNDDILILPDSGVCMNQNQSFNITLDSVEFSSIPVAAQAPEPTPTREVSPWYQADDLTKDDTSGDSTTDKTDTDTPVREVIITKDPEANDPVDETGDKEIVIVRDPKTTETTTPTDPTDGKEVVIIRDPNTSDNTDTDTPVREVIITKDPEANDPVDETGDKEIVIVRDPKTTETTTPTDPTDGKEVVIIKDPGAVDTSKNDSISRFFVANENDDNGTRLVGVAEYNAQGTHQSSHTSTNNNPSVNMLSMSGITQLGATLYASGNRLYQMDTASQTQFRTLTLRDTQGNPYNGDDNVNALCHYNGQLVIVGSAGGWIHIYDPVSHTLNYGAASGFDTPQGCTQVGGDLFVIDRKKIHRLQKCGDGFASEVFYELDSIDPTHFSEGGLTSYRNYLLYTNHGADWNSGHLIAVNINTREGKIVTPITFNPRGVAIDPEGNYIYVSQMTNTAVVKIRRDKAFNYLNGEITTPPLVEPFINDENHLAGPVGLHWLEDPATTLQVVPSRDDLCDDEDGEKETETTPPGGDKDVVITTQPKPDDSGTGTTTPTDPTDDKDIGIIKDPNAPGTNNPLDPSTPTPKIVKCGDGIKEGNETCDFTHEEDGDLVPIGYDPRIETCSQDCQKHTKISVDERPLDFECGNGILEGLEECENPDKGFNPLLSICDEKCSVHPRAASCNNNGIKENGELCDGMDGIDPETQECHFCKIFPKNVAPVNTCGNGIKEQGELCDGTDGLTNPETQACVHCKIVDKTQPKCGNNIQENGEQCDGSAVPLHNGEFCTADCQISMEIPDPTEKDPVCGNNIHEAGEQCDGPGSFSPEFQTCENCLIRTHGDGDGDENDDDEDQNEDGEDVNEGDESDDPQDDTGEDTSGLALCGNGELNTGEDCDPALVFAEGSESLIRICNYRCQYITLVLSCCPNCKDHEQHQHDLPPQDNSPQAEPNQPQDLSSDSIADTAQPATGISGTPSQNQEASSTQNQATSNPWGGYGLSGGGCQLQKHHQARTSDWVGFGIAVFALWGILRLRKNTVAKATL